MLLNDALKKIQILFAEKNYVLALAKINKILKKNKQNLDLINNKSSILIAMERIDEAHNELQKIIKIEPNFIEAYINLGIVYHKKKLHKKAIDSYERALEIDKKSLQSIFNLASLYLEIDQCELALEKLNSIYVEAYSIDYFHQLMAECYIRELNYDKALAHHIIATEKNPNNPLNWFLLGVDYVWAGDKSNAEYNFMQAIKLNPKYAEAYFALTKVKDIDISSNLFKNILPLIGDEKIAERDKVFLYFALSNIYEGIKDYEHSFQFMDSGNKLRKKIQQYSFKNDLSFSEKIQSVYKFKIKNLTIDHSKVISKKTPIFILGMPRSGTSLIEQIISNNNVVFGGGELNTIHEELKKIIDSPTIENDIDFVRERYLKKLDRFSDKNYIIDKLPLNFLWVGYILKIFPYAKIIHTIRDPIANCFSLYKTLFIEGALEFAYSQKDIIDFFNMYQTIMHFWKVENKDQFIEVSYEDLIDNPRDESKRIYDFIGINFDLESIDIKNNKRWVRTASDIQVRERINKKNKQQWKDYQNNLYEILKNFD